MKPFTVGIAGGTGAGKTTLAAMLEEREPGIFRVLHLDGYFKPREDIPWIEGIQNYERPEAIDFERLARDIEAAKVRADSPVILVEGFLLLADERIRTLLDLSIYLDLPIEEAIRRRLSAPDKYNAEEYLRDILIPAHTQFVEPTMAYADWVLDVSAISAEEVYGLVRERIEESLETYAAHPRED